MSRITTRSNGRDVNKVPSFAVSSRADQRGRYMSGIA